MKGIVRPFYCAPTVARVLLVDFTDLYASLGRHTAIYVAYGVANVLIVLVEAPFLLTASD